MNPTPGFLLLLLGCSPGQRGKDAGAADSAEDEGEGALGRDTGQELGARLWYPDGDADGYGDASGAPVSAVDQPEGHVASSDDCDDEDPQVHPGASEHCDGVDEDCDGLIDEDPVDPATWHPDADGDGYGDVNASISACDAPEGAVADGTDCDDTRTDIHPDAEELCGDDLDNDCDGELDEVPDDYTDWVYPDRDGDGYGDATSALPACTAPPDYISTAGDCDDYNPSISPDAPREYCAGVDVDCDGLLGSDDPDAYSTWYYDEDGDGYGDERVRVTGCDAPDGAVAEDGDCDDTNPDISPGAAEICGDDVDENCDGVASDCGFWGEHTVDEVASDYTGSDGEVLGYVVASAGDVDGDGLQDLWAGAPSANAGGLNRGAVRLVPGGSATGAVSDVETASLLGETDNGMTGFRVLDAGDVDDDGYEDVWTSSFYDADDTGAIVGSASLLLGPFDGERALSDADLSWEGIDDLDQAGYSIAGNADLDGDGLLDVAVASIRRPFGTDPAGDYQMGVVYVLYQDPIWGARSLASADVLIDGTAAFDQLGRNLQMVCDLDGDGLPELLISSTANGDAGSSAGAVYILADSLDFGVYEVNDVTQEIVGQTALGLGQSLADVGDLDGDGYEDFAVGGSGESTLAKEAGATYLFHGPADDVESVSDATTVLLGSVKHGNATAVSGGQDFDQDGNLDLIVGASSGGSGSDDPGRAYLLRGPIDSGTLSLADEAAATFQGDDGLMFGVSTAFLGDTDGDGDPDLAIGASGEDDGTVWLILGRAFE